MLQLTSPLDLGPLRIMSNCLKGHQVIGLMDGEFCLAEVHIPNNTPLREIEPTVVKVILNQL